MSSPLDKLPIARFRIGPIEIRGRLPTPIDILEMIPAANVAATEYAAAQDEEEAPATVRMHAPDHEPEEEVPATIRQGPIFDQEG